MKSEKVIELLESIGIPGKNAYDLPTSTKTFPDGSHYGIEISGVERPSTLKALVKKSNELDVPVHRIIGMVMGASNLSDYDMKEYAETAAENRIEVIVTPGPRPTHYNSKQLLSPEGALSGLRMRGQDQTQHLVKDIMRAVEFGFRGFLVWDEGMLDLLDDFREKGYVPENTTYKVSIFAGHGTAQSARLLERLGANTFNPVADIGLPELAAIRQTTDIPMDLHIALFNSFGGFDKRYYGPEMARVASPCFFKIEPGADMGSLYAPLVPEGVLENSIIRKVEYARSLVNIIQEDAPELKIMEEGAKHLAVPEVN